MRYDPVQLRKEIDERFKFTTVVPRHNEKGHFYQICHGHTEGVECMCPIYPSVTGKIQILKDEGLINYKMNRAIEYLKNFIYETKGTIGQQAEGEVMRLIDEAGEKASRVSQDILVDAGDIGTQIHDVRQAIFDKWIETGVKPEDFLSFIPVGQEDIRLISAIRALRKFVDEWHYTPVKCELFVYSNGLKVAGTLDDLGIIRTTIREGAEGCDHLGMISAPKAFNVDRCVQCDGKWKWEFVLMDLKSSNQFKDHYFFQVALYYDMFRKITKLNPDRCFILKVSKTDGTYKIEDLKRPKKLAEYCRHMVKTNEGLEFIKGLRKDNQREVARI